MVTNTDEGKDVVYILSAVIRDAHQQADMVVAFLESVGFLPPKAKRNEKSWSLPPDFLLKLGALLKLHLWDKSDLKDHLPDHLPCWQDVYTDVVAETMGEDTHFSGQQLESELLNVFFERLCWQPLESGTSAVAISQTLDPDVFLDVIAQMLWEHRHLGHNTHDEEDGDEPKNKE